MSAETPLLTETAAGFLVFYRGRQLYPAPPEPTARQKAEGLPLEPETLYVLASPLLWYGVARLAARLPANSRLVVLEVDPRLHALADWGRAREVCGTADIRLIPPASPADMARALANCLDRRIRRVRSIGLNGGRLAHQERYQQLVRHAEDELRRFWRNQATLLYMGRLWMRNLISNLPDGGVHDLASHPRHPSVMVVGAGPSLDEALPLIRQHRLVLFLVAVDTAIPNLVRNGLMPDLIIAVEAQLANLKDFIPAGLELPAVACDLTASPLVFRHFRCRERWLFSSDFAPGHLWESLAGRRLLPLRIPALGSVGVAAVYLCRQIASERVLLAGLDFAWVSGATHAKDSPSRLAALHSLRRLDGAGGETASLRAEVLTDPAAPGQFTDKVLSSYRDSLDEVIGALENDGIAVFDLRRSGLPLKARKLDPGQLAGELARTGTGRGGQSPAGEANGSCGATMAHGEERIAAAKGWLDSLATEILETIAGIDGWLRAAPDQPAPGGQDTLARLARLDFLFHELPDRDWPTLNPGALVRARVILEYYRDFILRRS
jgi:hypothetical protein